MTGEPKILVATEVLADADLVHKLLDQEFSNIRLSVVPERAVADFESFKPDVLVLAFNDLEKAERYYLGLYRLGREVHVQPHRTVILCNKDDLRRVYELCKREYFDDYILFWPMTHDVSRLPMAVHHALRQMRADSGSAAPPAALLAQAKQLAQLETRLRQYAEHGEQRVDAAQARLQRAGDAIDQALGGFSHRLADGQLPGVVDPGALQQELDRLLAQGVQPTLRDAREAMAPVRNWLGALPRELAPELQSARMLGAYAQQLRPLVMIVDDDELQLRAMTQALAPQHTVVTADTGTAALGVLRKQRPDLILMDVGLPDIDGIEMTRRIKSVEHFAAIPIVMVTGRSEKHLVVNSLAAGAADFIVKPFDRAKLLAKVAKLLGGGAEPAEPG